MDQIHYRFLESKRVCLSFTKTLGALFLFIIIGLFFDCQLMHSVWPKTQIISDVLMGMSFTYLYKKSTIKIRELMLYAVGISIVGEYLFSIVLEMYTYSLKNVPIYVFFGHAIVYIAVLYFCKEPAIKANRKRVELLFVTFIVSYATVYLLFFNDTFGFILTCITLYFLKDRPKQRLFFLSMYILIVVLEQVGTHYACWYWPDTAWGVIPFLKSANPPSGISFFYFGLDLGCLYIYKKRHQMAWNRMKNIRMIRMALG